MLYEEHYIDMRERYIYIKSFRDEMVALENWLIENRERWPKSARGWKRQVGNWCRLADKFAKRQYERALATGRVKDLKMNTTDAGLRLSQIIKRAGAEKSEEKQHADPINFGDALKLIGGNNDKA